ncbi:Csu type fimbrial protein [Caulobacter soli]|uniref:Csu type fimbrial protein n=1 Tax=Caulobacter soli TaxID=2708539 RepID=UPI0013ECE39D|nr:spore coat U domain-containing protein [Caulobacter soli]
MCLLIVSLSFGGTAWLGAPTRAHAAASCGVTMTNGSFGTMVSPLTAGVVDTTSTLTFSCSGLTPGIPISLCPNLDAGSAGGDGAGGRYLKTTGGVAIPFQIYQDASRTQTWGSASLLVFGAVPTFSATPGSGGTILITKTLYGRIWTQTTTVPGTYSTDFTGQNFFWGLNLLSCAGITIGYGVSPATFTFSTTLIPDCQVTSSVVNFGTAGVLTANKDGQGGLGVTCTSGTTYNVGLDNGLTGTGPTLRKMKKGSEAVTYGLYKNTNRDQPWGLVAQGAAYVSGGTGTGAAQPLTVYGRVPPQATPSPGPYADTVVATVTY